MPEMYIYDDDDTVVDTYCVHDFDDQGICTDCGYIKPFSSAYCDIYGCDLPDYE